MRLDELEKDLLLRRHRAHAESWLGEIDGIDQTLAFLRGKRAEALRLMRRTPLIWGFLGHVLRSSMTTTLSPTTIQRLTFVRFLHEQGITQSSQPEPLSAAAVLSFQDAVEHLLLIAADHLKVNLPTSMQFLQYWERLNPALPTGQELPNKQALDRVNKIRVALKHYGTIPSTQAIQQAKADVSTFFTDATKMIFDVDFAE